jgi:hypothetical protein
VPDLDWARLRVLADDADPPLYLRSAVFSEDFPAVLAKALASTAQPEAADSAYTDYVARQVLLTFAGAWGSLGRDEHGAYAYLPLTLPDGSVILLRYTGVELPKRHGEAQQVVIGDVIALP